MSGGLEAAAAESGGNATSDGSAKNTAANGAAAVVTDAIAGAKDAGGEALKWRIDVEDYESEDGSSVVGSVLESLPASIPEYPAGGAREGEEDDDDKNDDEISFIGGMRPPVVGSTGLPPQNPVLMERSAKPAPPAPATTAAREPLGMARAQSMAPPAAASMVSAEDLSTVQAEVGRLFAALKEARGRRADAPAEQEIKAAEVARLQAALKDARAKVAQIDAVRPKQPAGSQGRAPAAAVAGAGVAGAGGMGMARSMSEMPPRASLMTSPAHPAAGGAGGAPATTSPVHPSATPLRPATAGSRGVALSASQPGEIRRTVSFAPAPTAPSAGGGSPPVALQQAASLQSRPSPAPAAPARPAYVPPPSSAMIAPPAAAPSASAGARSVGYDKEEDKEDSLSGIGWASQTRGSLVSSDDIPSHASHAASQATPPPGGIGSPWRTQSSPYRFYKGPGEGAGAVPGASGGYGGSSAGYGGAAPRRSAYAESDMGDAVSIASSQIAWRSQSSDPRRQHPSLSRRLGNLPGLAAEGAMVPDVAATIAAGNAAGGAADNSDAQSVAASEVSIQPGPNNALMLVPTVKPTPPPQSAPPKPAGNAEGSIDLQVFSKLLAETRTESDAIAKLKQQNKLLQSWYAEAKAWADEKSLRAWEATSMADDAEDVAAVKHRMLKELDGKLGALKERLAGMTMLEQENRVLRQRIQAMASVRGPNQLLEQLKNAPRIDVNALRSRGQDMDALARWINEMKEEGGQVERLKKLNKLLQGWYADANSRAEDALQREKEEFIRAKAAEELAAAGDLLILEMEAKFSEMRMKLAARQMLEQENRELHQKIVALSAGKAGSMSIHKQEETLMECVRQSLGFSRGRPVMACIVYKAMVHWSMIEVERMNTFDKLMEHMQAVCKADNNDLRCYWLSNTVHLHFLNTRGPSRMDNTVAKSQLGVQIEKLYVVTRDAMKHRISLLLNDLLQPPPVNVEEPGYDFPDSGSAVSGASTVSVHKLVPTPGNVRRQMTMFWEGLMGALRCFVDECRGNYVPPLLVREFMAQLLQYVDVKLFNSVMMHCPWVPCTFTNGETMEAGMSDLEDWLGNVDEWLDATLVDTISLTSSLIENIKHIRQTVGFLLDESKPGRKLQHIQRMCPDLSVTQLAHICTWFEDDKDGSPGVDPAVIEQMWALMTEDAPFLLKEDKSCPFQTDEVSRSMKEFVLDDIDPPAALRSEPAFYFLIPAQQRQQEQLQAAGLVAEARKDDVTSQPADVAKWLGTAAVTLSATAALFCGSVDPAFADVELKTYYGTAASASSYGGYGGNASKQATAEYIYGVPDEWKERAISKVEKGTNGTDSEFFWPKNRNVKTYVTFLAGFRRLPPQENVLSDIALSDVNLQ
ncbi:unnamed protein product, partial [Closterium sp. Naga37s-1]